MTELKQSAGLMNLHLTSTELNISASLVNLDCASAYLTGGQYLWSGASCVCSHAQICRPTLAALQGAARMLIRVSADIVHFPKHVVPILTSTVMECQRAGLHRSAFSHCQALMQPDLVESINPAYRHKAAGLLRQDPGRWECLSWPFRNVVFIPV